MDVEWTEYVIGGVARMLLRNVENEEDALE